MMRLAYKQPNKVLVVDDKMYIAGSITARDWYDDFTNLPFYGDTKKAERYQQATEMLDKNPQVKSLTGHSLGSSIAFEIAKNNPGKYETVSYGGPIFQPFNNEQGNRYRHGGDIVSMFDKGAKTVDFSFNPLISHIYTGYNGISSNTIAENKQI